MGIAKQHKGVVALSALPPALAGFAANADAFDADRTISFAGGHTLNYGSSVFYPSDVDAVIGGLEDVAAGYEGESYRMQMSTLTDAGWHLRVGASAFEFTEDSSEFAGPPEAYVSSRSNMTVFDIDRINEYNFDAFDFSYYFGARLANYGVATEYGNAEFDDGSTKIGSYDHLYSEQGIAVGPRIGFIADRNFGNDRFNLEVEGYSSILAASARGVLNTDFGGTPPNSGDAEITVQEFHETAWVFNPGLSLTLSTALSDRATLDFGYHVESWSPLPGALNDATFDGAFNFGDGSLVTHSVSVGVTINLD